MKNAALKLILPASFTYMPVAAGFAERSGRCFGLTKTEALAVTLAAEEIFTHITHFIRPSVEVEITCHQGSHYMRMDFIFAAEEVDLRAFNLTAALSIDDQESLDQMGLFLASRSVDQFEFTREEDDRVKLTLIKEKAYPEAKGVPSISMEPMIDYVIRAPDQAETNLLVESINGYYSASSLPGFFRYPGKVVDMIAGDECRAAAAFGPTGRVGGGMFWRWWTPKSVEFFGPYLPGQPDASSMSAELVDYCINQLARTGCINLISRFTTDALPQEYFQDLGELTYWDDLGEKRQRTAYFRLMREDLGSQIWCHPELADYLKKEYQRLHLPREIQTVSGLSRNAPPHSVLSSQVDILHREVVLLPVCIGQDIETNLAGHLRLFAEEGLRVVFFLIDLGQGWQADFIPSLFKGGFKPRVIFPYGGKGDQILFQLENNRS